MYFISVYSSLCLCSFHTLIRSIPGIKILKLVAPFVFSFCSCPAVAIILVFTVHIFVF